MTPDELLQRYPRETVRWLRGQVGLSQLAFALEFELNPNAVADWETGHYRIGPANRARLAPLLAPRLATAEGRAWLATLGEEPETRGGEPCRP